MPTHNTIILVAALMACSATDSSGTHAPTTAAKPSEPTASGGTPTPAGPSQPDAPTADDGSDSEPVAAATPEPASPKSASAGAKHRAGGKAPGMLPDPGSEPGGIAQSPSATWKDLVKQNVSGGKVDYDGFANSRANLRTYLAWVASRSGKQKMSFYLNAYNATVVEAILANNRPARVLDAKGFFDKQKHEIAGQSWTLNQLEGYVRETFKDPRIHFALNCAARSCPPLYGAPFSEGSLDKTLTRLTTRFLNGPGVRASEGKKQIAITKLFEWYKQDFVEKEGSVEAYLKKWVTEPRRKAALDAGYEIAYQNYDWALNKK